MQFGMSITPVMWALVFQSVENVSGQKPAFMIFSTLSQRIWPVCPLPTSNQTPRRLAASTSGRIRPLSSVIPFAGGADKAVAKLPVLNKLVNLGAQHTL